MKKFGSHLRTDRSGFTLIDNLTIIGVIGALGAIAAPNISALLNRIKLDQAIAEVKGALEETQRQAIRGNKVCTVTLNLTQEKVTGSCLTTGDRILPKAIDITTNMINAAAKTDTSITSNTLDKDSPSETTVVSDISSDFKLIHGTGTTKVAMATSLGDSANESKAAMVIHIISNAGVNSSTIPIKFGSLGTASFSIATSVESPELPLDPSGKIVLSLPNSPKIKKKCVAISNTLGLARIGTYIGNLNPVDITHSGVCTILNRDAQ